MRLGQHVGGGADGSEHVVAWVGQRCGAHEARVGGDRESRGADGAHNGGARVGERVILDGQPVGDAVFSVRLGQAHVEVSARDLNGVAQEGRGRGRVLVATAVIRRGRWRGFGGRFRRRRGFRFLGGGDAVTHCQHGGESHVVANGDVGGISDGHDRVGEGVGAQNDAHVHGVGLAHAEVLGLRVHASRTQGAFHGAPGAEIPLGFEELDLVGGAQGRVVRTHRGRVLVGRAGLEVVGDIDAARGEREVVGVPHGRWVRVGVDEDRVGGADGDWFGVLLGVLHDLRDPARRSGIAGNVDRLDGCGVLSEQLGDGCSTALDGNLGEEVAVDGDPRTPGVGGNARVDRDVGEEVVAGVGALGVVGQGQRGLGLGAVTALGARGVVGGLDVLDRAIGGVLTADLPDQRRNRRGVDGGPVGAARGHLVVCDVSTGLREGRIHVRVTRVVDAAVGRVVAGEETVDAVAVVDEHLHAPGAINADEVERVGLALELVGVADLAGTQARPDGGIARSGVLGGRVQDGPLGAEERQIGALGGYDQLRLRLILLAGSGPRLGDPQGGLLHR